MSNDKAQDNEKQGMEFLQSLPRRWVTIYIPLAIFVFVLLFPFYWMVITSFKPDAELGMHTSNPFWVVAPTLVHFKNLIFDTAFPEWMLNRSEEHTSKLQSLMRISYAVFCLKQKKTTTVTLTKKINQTEHTT